MADEAKTPVAGLEYGQGNPFREVRKRLGLTEQELARKLHTSLYALVRWERGDLKPGTEVLEELSALLDPTERPGRVAEIDVVSPTAFASNGSKARIPENPSLFAQDTLRFIKNPKRSVLQDIFRAGSLWGDGELALAEILERRHKPAITRSEPVEEEVSAGKNTYTYDAHSYHTKVPPQGIASVMSKYLPHGGLVLDPFSGSGMTGVAARFLGNDVILNELSPAASFISYNFLSTIDLNLFQDATAHILSNLKRLEQDLYTTRCRECDADVIQLYTVWSYILQCSHCNKDFVVWKHCRQYGKTVREHKILRKFPCPSCLKEVNKSHLKRKQTVPVFVGYRCCSKRIVEHPLEDSDYVRIKSCDAMLNEYSGQFPQVRLPDGVNLNQPKRHGLDTIAKLYTPRNLVACAALWKEIQRIEDPDLAAALAFVFTSLYRRITRLSEYRFWGGSGNMAALNVPHISNEANGFVTFRRKAASIGDHFATTAARYTGDSVIRTGSATNLDFLPANSVDFIFTDPPFGSNINYSEMNLLWEAWLGEFTDTRKEAIVNKRQGKNIDSYRDLMTQSLREAYRVLRPDHWMVLVFMNSSKRVWSALRDAIEESGFEIQKTNMFDKQHGTFKQFVSENAAGADLMIHCKKPSGEAKRESKAHKPTASVSAFMRRSAEEVPVIPYIHVKREPEVDYRVLYSRYVSSAIQSRAGLVGFADFRKAAQLFLEAEK